MPTFKDALRFSFWTILGLAALFGAGVLILGLGIMAPWWLAVPGGILLAIVGLATMVFLMGKAMET